MPIYEYKCDKCDAISSFIENSQHKFQAFLKRKCEKCGSRKLKKVFSTFSANCVKSNADTMNDLSKMGDINFVPQSPGMGGQQGPPPGGCPYGCPSGPPSDD